MNPWRAVSPTSRLAPGSLNVVHTDPAEGWSLATMTWDRNAAEGCRWDGDLNNPDDLGNPTSHGHGTWFILPVGMIDKMLDGVDRTPAAK